MTELEALQEVITLAGGQQALAEKMNEILEKQGRAERISQPKVSQWVNKSKKIPPEFAKVASKAIGRKIKAITLRPDVFGEVA